MNSPVILEKNPDLSAEVAKNGFFVLPGFFCPKAVMAARAELAQLLDRDLAARDAEPAGGSTRMDEGRFKTVKTPEMHTRFFPSFESPKYAALLESMFGVPQIKSFVEKSLGNIRLRSDLIRRASGIDDSIDDEFQIPHNWHRDSPGEFTFGIFFDDVTVSNSGGTGVIPGTHTQELHPLWDLMLSPEGKASHEDYLTGALQTMPAALYDDAPLNHAVRAELSGQQMELCGKPGDIYFFLNDIWHGRFPNQTGQQFMISRIGAFSARFPFKDDTPLPVDTDGLPPVLKQLYMTREKSNRTIYLDTLSASRSSPEHFHAAAAEKNRLIKKAKQMTSPPKDAKAQLKAAQKRAALAKERLAQAKAQRAEREQEREKLAAKRADALEKRKRAALEAKKRASDLQKKAKEKANARALARKEAEKARVLTIKANEKEAQKRAKAAANAREKKIKDKEKAREKAQKEARERAQKKADERALKREEAAKKVQLTAEKAAAEKAKIRAQALADRSRAAKLLAAEAKKAKKKKAREQAKKAKIREKADKLRQENAQKRADAIKQRDKVREEAEAVQKELAELRREEEQARAEMAKLRAENARIRAENQKARKDRQS